MSDKQLSSIPEPVLRRLVQYHYFLTKHKELENQLISSTTIAEHLNLESILVRKDLQYTGLTGKSKTGWNVSELLEKIEEILGWNNYRDVFLVGAGRLGSTLLNYTGFKNYGINFIAAFDVDSNLIGTEINGVKVLPINKLANLAQRMHIHIGVITVPVNEAQMAADLLVEGGIMAIWNFAPVKLNVPDNIIVSNSQMAQEISILVNKLTCKLKLNQEK